MDLNALFVPFSKDENDVAVSGLLDSLEDRISPIDDNSCIRTGYRVCSAFDLTGDRIRVFGSGIVLGDDRDIREPNRCGAHESPLVLVSVSCGPDHSDDPTTG